MCYVSENEVRNCMYDVPKSKSEQNEKGKKGERCARFCTLCRHDLKLVWDGSSRRRGSRVPPCSWTGAVLPYALVCYPDNGHIITQSEKQLPSNYSP